jgi:predicted amidohydrolase
MKYENKVTLACVNFSGEWGNKAARLEKMKTQVKLAARQEVDMIVFPELALSGYQCDEEGTRLMKPCAMHGDTAETIPGPATEEMAELAKEHDIYIIFGMPERDKISPKIHYNSAAIVAPEGILGAYRKIHLATPAKLTETYSDGLRESVCFAPGTELPIWET